MAYIETDQERAIKFRNELRAYIVLGVMCEKDDWMTETEITQRANERFDKVIDIIYSRSDQTWKQNTTL